MKSVFYFWVTLSFIVCQTVFIPSAGWFEFCFDFQLINVLFLSLHFSGYSLVIGILFIGCVMDSLSGAPFLYFTFSYLLLWALVQGMRRFVFSRSIAFVMMISLVSVLIEQLLYIFILLVRQDGTGGIDLVRWEIMVRQLVMGLAVIPPSVWCLNRFFDIYMRMASKAGIKIRTLISE